MNSLLGLSPADLCRLAQQEGEPSYRGKQLADWIYSRGAGRLEEMSNLSVAFRTRIGARYGVGRSRVAASQTAADGTFKLLLEMSGGAMVETVGLPYRDRFSCCVSTQVGCAMGCLFCATGMSGFSRNLTAGEIVDQVLTVRESARFAPSVVAGGRGERVDHVTFMGMGEPLLNYDSTLSAIGLLNSAMGIAARNLTVSTAGVVPGIRRLAAEKLQITLAVSLHAPNDELRRYLMPGMTKWPIDELLDACRDYFSLTGRRVTFEYCLLDGVNDGETEAHQLAGLLRGLNCHVNLIPLNKISCPGLNPSPPYRIKAFRDALSRGGIQVTQRMQRGADIDAACGQLMRRSA